MNNLEFMKSVNRTWNQDLSKRDSVLNAAMGLSGESGEVIDELKKWAFHGKELNKDNLYEELGDVIYYIQAMLLTFDDGVTIEDLCQQNSDKLKKRHPVKFDPKYHKEKS